MPGKSYERTSLRKALELLLYFKAKREWGISELSRSASLPKATVQKVLYTFTNQGYLVQDTVSKQFGVGPELLALGSLTPLRTDTRAILMPHMRRIWEITGETVHLNAAMDLERVAIASIESPHELHASVQVGQRSPLTRGASAKVLLAFLQEPRRGLALRHLPAAARAETRQELVRIRRIGYAITQGERLPGVTSVAVALRLPLAPASVFSLCVSGPSVRLGKSKQAEIRDLLVREAAACVDEVEELGSSKPLVPSGR